MKLKFKHEHHGYLAATLTYVAFVIAGFMLQDYGVIGEDLVSWLAWMVFTAYTSINFGAAVARHIKFCVDVENLK